MADTAKSPAKKTKAVKKPAAHPTYSEMIKTAIGSLKERGGSSRQALLKYIMANFKVGTDAKPVNAHLKVALRNGVKKGTIKQSKGTGAAGSFKLGEQPKPKKPTKPKAKKVTKPKAAAPKAKKPVKKATGEKKTTKPKKPATKKTAEKKTPKKTTKPKTPKKAKATKSPKKTKTTKPKKAKTPKKQ